MADWKYITPHHQKLLLDKISMGASDVCWEWQAGLSRGGYGKFCVRIAKGQIKNYVAHRAAYYVLTGNDPGEFFLCHKCDNPKCCNPSHLFLGSQLDNMRDKLAKGRQAKERCVRKTWDNVVRGAAHPLSKLSAEAVRNIRTVHAAGAVTFTQLATQYGVSEGLVRGIVKRTKWRHIT